MTYGRIRSLLAIAAVAILLTTESNATQSQLNDKLKAFLQEFAQGAPPSPDETLRVSTANVDLRGDGTKETLVYLNGRDWCGSGGCHLLVLVPQGSSFKIVSRIPITRPPIRILPTRSHGWSDLGVTVAGGGIMRAYVAKLPFNGVRYAENPTMPPASPAKGAKGTIAISADDPGEALFP